MFFEGCIETKFLSFPLIVGLDTVKKAAYSTHDMTLHQSFR